MCLKRLLTDSLSNPGFFWNRQACLFVFVDRDFLQAGPLWRMDLFFRARCLFDDEPSSYSWFSRKHVRRSVRTMGPERQPAILSAELPTDDEQVVEGQCRCGAY
jgi:hypothetical protein